MELDHLFRFRVIAFLRSSTDIFRFQRRLSILDDSLQSKIELSFQLQCPLPVVIPDSSGSAAGPPGIESQPIVGFADIFLQIIAHGVSAQFDSVAHFDANIIEEKSFLSFPVILALPAADMIAQGTVGIEYGRFDPFELPTWFTINVFMFMVVSGLNGFSNPNALYARLQGDYSYLVLALVYVCLGTLALWVGYRFGLVRRGPKTESIHSDVLSNFEHLRLKVVLSLYLYSKSVLIINLINHPVNEVDFS